MTQNITNPFEHLKEDHQRVAKMMEELAETTEAAEKGRKETLEKLRNDFLLHAEKEEKFLYPLAEQEESVRELALEAKEEHKAAKTILEELSGTATDSEEWKAKLMVFKENVEHHVEEEETSFFPKVEKALQKEQIDELTQNLIQFQEKNN